MSSLIHNMLQFWVSAVFVSGFTFSIVSLTSWQNGRKALQIALTTSSGFTTVFAILAYAQILLQ